MQHVIYSSTVIKNGNHNVMDDLCILMVTTIAYV